MSWPSSIDYNEALQNPQHFSDPELKQGIVFRDNNDLPMPYAGGFAAVYQVTAKDGKKWAARCFLKHYDDSQNRYAEIASYLEKIELCYTLRFIYQPKGIIVSGKWFPLIKMEWADGQCLDQYIQDKVKDNQAKSLTQLAEKWVDLMQTLKTHSIAHGDLHHGNIIITEKGELRLVDYDDLFVPNLTGWKSHGLGFPAYQHPQRSETDFNQNIDRFSALVIYLSIIAIANDPTIVKRYSAFQNDNIIFKAGDFKSPDNSQLFKELLLSQIEEVRSLSQILMEACRQPFCSTPDLLDLLDKIKKPEPSREKIQKPNTVNDSNNNGISNAPGLEKDTGNIDKVPIQSSEGLSQEEIEETLQEAQASKEEDAIKKEAAEVKTSAVSLILSLKSILDNNKDKVSKILNPEVEGIITSLRIALQENNINKIKSDSQLLNESIMKIRRDLNTKPQTSPPPPREDQGSPSPPRAKPIKSNNPEELLLSIFQTTQCSWCRRFYTKPMLCPFDSCQSNCSQFDYLNENERGVLINEERWRSKIFEFIRYVQQWGVLARCHHESCLAFNPNPQKSLCWKCGLDTLCCPNCKRLLFFNIKTNTWECQNTNCNKKFAYIKRDTSPSNT